MKKSAIFIMAFMLLCSCGKASDYGPENVHRSWTISNINNNGEFYTDSERRLKFFDFSSMQEALVCSKPNCPHTEESGCSAFGMENHPTVCGENLYFFDSESSYDKNGQPTTELNLYKSALDGSGRIKLSKLDDYRFEAYDLALVVGNEIFFTGVKNEFDYDTYSDTGFSEEHLFGCRYSDGQFTDYGEVFSGYSTNAHIDGFYNGSVYVSVSWLDEKVGMEMFNLEHYDELQKMYKHKYFRLDLKTGELSDTDMPLPQGESYLSFVGEGYYIYMDGGDTVVIDSVGNSQRYVGADSSDCYVVDDRLFTRGSDRVCIDLASGKFNKISEKIPASAEVIYKIDGEYVIKNQGEYIRAAIDELFEVSHERPIP